LRAGVPVDRVSVLLGHHNIRIAERQYSAWVENGKNNSNPTRNGRGAKIPLP